MPQFIQFEGRMRSLESVAAIRAARGEDPSTPIPGVEPRPTSSRVEGTSPTDAPAPLSPQQRAALTRAANAAKRRTDVDPDTAIIEAQLAGTKIDPSKVQKPGNVDHAGNSLPSATKDGKFRLDEDAEKADLEAKIRELQAQVAAAGPSGVELITTAGDGLGDGEGSDEQDALIAGNSAAGVVPAGAVPQGVIDETGQDETGSIDADTAV